MRYEFSQRSKFIGSLIGFIAGVYSLLAPGIWPPVTDWTHLFFVFIWFLLIGAMTIANAWGMLHYSELMRSSERTRKVET